MEKITSLKLRQPKVFTREQALAEQVWLYFNKLLSFPRIMRMIKGKGHQAVYEAFNEVKHDNKIREKLGLFIWKVKQYEVKWSTPKDKID